MVRKTFIALTAVAALGVSSVAMAAGGHGGGGSPGGGHSSGSVSSSGGMGHVGPSGATSGRVQSFNSGPARPGFNTGPARPGMMGPRTRMSGTAWNGNWNHHHRFARNAFFFGVGFAGPYDSYDSCWRIVPNYWGGWQRVWVCDYPYWGY